MSGPVPTSLPSLPLRLIVVGDEGGHICPSHPQKWKLGTRFVWHISYEIRGHFVNFSYIYFRAKCLARPRDCPELTVPYAYATDLHSPPLTLAFSPRRRESAPENQLKIPSKVRGGPVQSLGRSRVFLHCVLVKHIWLHAAFWPYPGFYFNRGKNLPSSLLAFCPSPPFSMFPSPLPIPFLGPHPLLQLGNLGER